MPAEVVELMRGVSLDGLRSGKVLGVVTGKKVCLFSKDSLATGEDHLRAGKKREPIGLRGVPRNYFTDCFGQNEQEKTMLKKITLGVVAVALLAGLAFGGKLIPYSQTAYSKFRDVANDSVPVSFQLDAARQQLQAIGPEIKSMVHEVAKEKVQINKLLVDLKQHRQMLDFSKKEMLALRNHLVSGDEFYVAVNNKKFDNKRVEEDLQHRFSIYKTAEATFEKKQEIITIREKSLGNALVMLEQAKVQRQELEVQIENLSARNRMNEVIAMASELDVDTRQLAKAREMLSDLDATISADEEYLNIMPGFRGQIPVSADSVLPTTDVLKEMDEYFGEGSKANEVEISDAAADLVGI